MRFWDGRTFTDDEMAARLTRPHDLFEVAEELERAVRQVHRLAGNAVGNPRRRHRQIEDVVVMHVLDGAVMRELPVQAARRHVSCHKHFDAARAAEVIERHVRDRDLFLEAVYEIPTERWGKFTFSGGWNHFFTWKAQADPAAGYHNFLGDYNNGTFPLAPGAIPFNKAFLRGEWEWKGFDFVSTVNYIGDFEDDPNFILGNDFVPGSPGTNPGDPPPANPSFILHRRVTSYITLDMQLSYEWVKPPDEPAPYVKESKDSKNVMQTEAATASIWQRMLWGTRLTVGVNNVFDRQPPSVIGAFNDNYDTSLYSIRNRYYYVSLTKKF
jgi:hypothetical protein